VVEEKTLVVVAEALVEVEALVEEEEALVEDEVDKAEDLGVDEAGAGELPEPPGLTTEVVMSPDSM
jgi:hypothetical protein